MNSDDVEEQQKITSKLEDYNGLVIRAGFYELTTARGAQRWPCYPYTFVRNNEANDKDIWAYKGLGDVVDCESFCTAFIPITDVLPDVVGVFHWMDMKTRKYTVNGGEACEDVFVIGSRAVKDSDTGICHLEDIDDAEHKSFPEEFMEEPCHFVSRTSKWFNLPQLIMRSVQDMLYSAGFSEFTDSRTFGAVTVEEWNLLQQKFGGKLRPLTPGLTTTHNVTPDFHFEKRYLATKTWSMKFTSLAELSVVTANTAVGWNCGIPKGSRQFDIVVPERGDNIRAITPNAVATPDDPLYRTGPAKKKKKKTTKGNETETEVETEPDAGEDDSTCLSDIIQAGSKRKAGKFRKPGLYLTYKRLLVDAYGELKVSVSWHDKIYNADGTEWKDDGKGDAENTFVCTSA